MSELITGNMVRWSGVAGIMVWGGATSAKSDAPDNTFNSGDLRLFGRWAIRVNTMPANGHDGSKLIIQAYLCDKTGGQVESTPSLPAMEADVATDGSIKTTYLSPSPITDNSPQVAEAVLFTVQNQDAAKGIIASIEIVGLIEK